MGRRRWVSPQTEAIRKALRERFNSPEYAFFEEVGNATGFKCNRHADGIAMGLWPSRGLFLNGIEIKVSRGDWLRELKNPEKADDIARFCDFWWLVVADEKIVHTGELPPLWGLLQLDGEKLSCKVEAKKLESAQPDRSFLAALLRRAAESMPALISEAERNGFERGIAEGPREKKHRAQVLQEDMDRLHKRIEEFEQKSGVKIDSWSFGHVGAAVNKLLRSRFDDTDPAYELDSAAEAIEHASKRMRQKAEEIRSAVKRMPKAVANG